MYVIGSLDRGGTETHLATIVPRLDSRLFNPEIFLLSHRGDLAKPLEEKGVSIHEPWVSMGPGKKRRPFILRVLRFALISFQLWLCLLRRRPKIVHFFLPLSHIIGAPAAVAARVPVRILSRRSLNNYQNKYPIFRKLEKFLARFSQAVLGNSNAVVKQLAFEEGIERKKLGLIYNGINLPQFDHSSASKVSLDTFGIDDRCLLFVIVANLIPYKGHMDLFDALSGVRRQITEDWRLLVVGGDNEFGRTLKNYVAKLGLDDHIIFTGSRGDVPELLKSCDIGILASHEEGFSNAILEYMAAGLPVLATDVGGNAESVVDGETGLIVPPSAPSELGEALVKLVKDPHLRRTMGSTGRARLMTEYTVDRCVDDYTHLYTTLLAGGSISDVPGIWAGGNDL